MPAYPTTRRFAGGHCPKHFPGQAGYLLSAPKDVLRYGQRTDGIRDRLGIDRDGFGEIDLAGNFLDGPEVFLRGGGFQQVLVLGGEEIQQFEAFGPFPGVEQLLEVPPGEQHERYVEDKTSVGIALLAGETLHPREIIEYLFTCLKREHYLKFGIRHVEIHEL